jgi:hypothetical protein
VVKIQGHLPTTVITKDITDHGVPFAFQRIKKLNPLNLNGGSRGTIKNQPVIFVVLNHCILAK